MNSSFTTQRDSNLTLLQAKYEENLSSLITAQKNLESAISGSDNPKDSQVVKSAQLEVGASNQKMLDLVDQLNKNIGVTNNKIKDFAKLADENRKQVLTRNQQILSQDKSLEDMSLKLISRNRQSEFSLERNGYSRVMLVILVIINVILMGYFGYLITRK